MQISPYLMFDGRCDEAIEFYKKTLGAKVTTLMRFKEAPDQANCKPGSLEKVMHAHLDIAGNQVMASDGYCNGHPEFKGVSLTITLPTADADKTFAALGDGGTVQVPLAKTFFSEKFGMLADKFGVNWIIVAQ